MQLDNQCQRWKLGPVFIQEARKLPENRKAEHDQGGAHHRASSPSSQEVKGEPGHQKLLGAPQGPMEIRKTLQASKDF